MTSGPTLVVWVEAQPNNHQIDHNFFAHRAPLGRNGGETMRIGTSDVSMNISRTLVEQNYFERCDGEAEIISNKSCENIYRGNTFVESQGCLTLRHGNRATVEGNFFFGHGRAGTGGIRVIGEDHKILNNYLEGLAGRDFQSAMPFVNGIPNSKPNEYFRVQRATVSSNTFVNCVQNITFGIGHAARNRIEEPWDVTLADNVIVTNVAKTPLIYFQDTARPPQRLKLHGNLLFGGTTDAGEVSATEPKVSQPQNSLKPSDVGPEWMRRK
jgi:poly(beta-D-mannuronate) lyase